MNTEQLQLVTFERAKRLKELGFDWLCDFYYAEKGKYLIERLCNNSAAGMNCKEAPYFAVPTVALALKWIRDEKGVLNGVSPQGIIPKNSVYQWSYIDENGDNYSSSFDTYESTESALLDEPLTILEKERENETD
jgi:hypothetical protein